MDILKEMIIQKINICVFLNGAIYLIKYDFLKKKKLSSQIRQDII